MFEWFNVYEGPIDRLMISKTTSKKIHRGTVKLTLVVALLLCVSAVVGSFLLNRVNRDRVVGNDALTFKVFRGEFVSSVNESGDIESSSNVEVHCEVKSQGKAGTAILEIIPEGTMVEKGDFLCQLDDSILQDNWTEQKIKVANDRASLIQSQNDLVSARGILKEFVEGTFEQELAKLKAVVMVARESKNRAAEFLEFSKSLYSKGYITKTQLDADRFAAEKAVLDLELAQKETTVFVEYTKDRMRSEYRAEIKIQEANVEASEFTLELSIHQQDDIQTQIKACRLVAPDAGMVVYANEVDRRGDASFVIEEGALIRDGQPIVRLPDPKKMQVRTTVNDSKINSVKEGQRALVRVDTEPESPVEARVRKVSSFPKPRRWYQAPIEYEVFVDIVEESPLIRPGLRGKVEIFVERLADVTMVPVSSLVRRHGDFYVVVKTESGVLQPRLVTIGSNNEKFIVLKRGVETGEEVLIDPENYSDDLVFPESSSADVSVTP